MINSMSTAVCWVLYTGDHVPDDGPGAGTSVTAPVF